MTNELTQTIPMQNTAAYYCELRHKTIPPTSFERHKPDKDSEEQLRKFNPGGSYEDLLLPGFNYEFLDGQYASGHKRMKFDNRSYTDRDYDEDQHEFRTKNKSWQYPQVTKWIGLLGKGYQPQNARAIVIQEEKERKTQARKQKKALARSPESTDSEDMEEQNPESPSKSPTSSPKGPRSTTSETSSSYRDMAVETEASKPPMLIKRKIGIEAQKPQSSQRNQLIRRKNIPNTGKIKPYTNRKKDQQRDAEIRRSYSNRGRKRSQRSPRYHGQAMDHQRKQHHDTGTPQLLPQVEMEKKFKAFFAQVEERIPPLAKKRRKSRDNDFTPLPEDPTHNLGETPSNTGTNPQILAKKTDEESEPAILQGNITRK